MAQSTASARYQHLLDVLLEERIKQGLLQKDLGSKMGKPQSFISKVERGERRIDPAELVDICVALGIDPAEVIQKIAAIPSENSSSKKLRKR
ncbi:MAG: DNA-binding protein [bacterium]|nr:MAG: DNA-binding protein [bacterium]